MTTMTRPQTTTTRRLGSILLAALLVTALVGAVAAPAAAQEEEDDGWTDGLFEDAAATIGDQIAGFSGTFARFVDKRFGDDPQTNATQNVEAFATTFNEIAADDPTFGDYLDGRINATDDRLTYEVTCSDRDGNTATRYVVADRDGDRFVNESAVTIAEFSEMNRSVDYWIEGDWYACEHADEELQTFYDNSVVPDEDVSKSEKLRLQAQYMSGIETNLWDDVENEST